MATQIKHRRGNTSEISNFTPAIAELIMNTDTDELILGNGIAQGGVVVSFKEVNTVLAMKSRTFKAGNRVVTKGYYTPGDGGGATYLISNAQVGAGDHIVGSLFAVLQTESATIKHFGAKMNMIDDDAPAISDMVSRVGKMDCPRVGPYENWELTGNLTHGVLIGSDIETKAFTTYDFNYNQVKITNGASFTPDTAVGFCVKPAWKNLNIVDSAGQTFIKSSTGKIYQSAKIESININTLDVLMFTEDSLGWFNLSINGIKTIALGALFKLRNTTGQTGNSLTDGLFQGTGRLIDVENATCQCNFSEINYGLDSATSNSAIIFFRGTVNTASDKLTFTNSFFEYDDKSIDTSVLELNDDSEYDIQFDKCGFFHSELKQMNDRGFVPFIMKGNRNRISFKGMSNWFTRYPDAQGVILKAHTGNVEHYDMSVDSIDFGSNSRRIRNIEKLYKIEDSTNFNFISGSYSISNNRLFVVFYGTTNTNLVSGDVIYDFAEITSFYQNVIHVSDYRIVAAASSGSINAGEPIPSGSGVSCNMIIDLSEFA